MTIKKLRKLRERIDKLRLRPANIKTSELERLAGKLGRKRAGKGTKHPMWVSKDFPAIRPLSIPHHSKSPLPKAAMSILDQLEEDWGLWAERLQIFGGNEHG